MVFLISLILTALLIASGRNFLKKHAAVCYVLAAAISAAVVVCTATGASAAFPAWVRSWIWPIFARSALSTTLFAAVMYAGAVPNGSKLMKAVMPIRGELSIIASILTLGHNISFGLTYFRLLFTQPDCLPVNQLLAAICSLVMLCIMLPLFITSFKCVRKKMKGSSWKKLQRLAYGFYALIYIHVLLLTLPGAQKGNGSYLLTVVVYSVVFLTYGALRVRKALQKQSTAVRRIPTVAAVCAMILVICAAAGPRSADSQPANGQEQSQEEVSGQEDAAKTAESNETAGETSENGSEEEASAEDEAETPVAEEPETSAGTPANSGNTNAPAEPAKQPEQEPQKPANEQPPAETQKPEETAKPAEPEIVYQYKNGTFSGSGEGFEGTITVNVTIENDKITNISVVSASDDEPYWSEGKGIISRIISAQSANVDTVSGATFSSGGILDAVKAALSSAKN